LRVNPASTTTNISNVTATTVLPLANSGTPGCIGMFSDATDLVCSPIYATGDAASVGGTASLGALTLIGSVPFGDASGMALYNQGGGAGASVSLDMYNTSYHGGIPQAKIKAIDDGAYSDHLTFWTKNAGAQNNAVTEKVRITSAGNVGIGTTTPAGKLEVAGALKVSGTGSGIIFPDGSTQTTAVVTPAGGSTNVAPGASALSGNTTGVDNTASGTGALSNNTTGLRNTANGYQALSANTLRTDNTATGSDALVNNTYGADNTANGSGALYGNTIGSENTAIGSGSLSSNTTGGVNVAVGYLALVFNTSGYDNTACGAGALSDNTTGLYNTATGFQALGGNTTGYYNTGSGYQALGYNNTGSFNAGLGYNAGRNVTGSYNVMIGNQGLATDDHVIRIGDVQTQTFIAGISGVNVSGVPVLVSSTGQLGIASSSRRYKEDIRDMGDDSQGLLRLRPVTFRYKQPLPDGSKPTQYGLIAEEVAEVYPDLVAHSADGQIETVKYQVLDSMLLNEVQRQQEEIRSLKERLARLESLLLSRQ